jgi:hypothetical protein
MYKLKRSELTESVHVGENVVVRLQSQGAALRSSPTAGTSLRGHETSDAVGRSRAQRGPSVDPVFRDRRHHFTGAELQEQGV